MANENQLLDPLQMDPFAAPGEHGQQDRMRRARRQDVQGGQNAGQGQDWQGGGPDALNTSFATPPPTSTHSTPMPLPSSTSLPSYAPPPMPTGGGFPAWAQPQAQPPGPNLVGGMPQADAAFHAWLTGQGPKPANYVEQPSWLPLPPAGATPPTAPFSPSPVAPPMSGKSVGTGAGGVPANRGSATLDPAALAGVTY